MLMLLEVLRSAFVFLAISTGLACPIVERLGLTPAERVVALPALSLLGVFLFAWAIYVFALPAAVFGLLPLLAAAGLLSGWRTLVGTWRDAAARSLVVSQLLVTGWCIAWMTTIASYSGGGWAGDWFEHWERTRFFLERWPLDRKFLLDYSLTARPPLVNVVVGAFLQLTRADFAHFQMGMTLFSSLAFLPAGLFALHWGGRRSIAVLALLFLVNPLFVENATFAWTKLPAGFFVLAALYFFLRSRGVGVPSGASLLGSALLGAGLLTHYSAGPYAVMLAAAWLGTAWARRRDLAWWRTTAGICLVGGLVLAVWFGWAVAHYGFAGTFFTNTSVTVPEAHGGVEPMTIALNLRDTLVPHFLRAFDHSFIAQRSPWGWLRDWFFLCYQANLLLAFGSVAWLVIVRELWRRSGESPRPSHLFWSAFVGGVVFLGVAANGARNPWGLAHICLQPLVLLGLAFLASRVERLGRVWQLVLLAGGTVDFCLGIVLQFAVESFALDRWLAADQPILAIFHSYTLSAFTNLAGKIHNHLGFFADDFTPPPALIVAILASILIVTLARTRPDQPCLHLPQPAPSL